MYLYIIADRRIKSTEKFCKNCRILEISKDDRQLRDEVDEQDGTNMATWQHVCGMQVAGNQSSTNGK